MPIAENEVGLQTGRVKAINGKVATINVQGVLINIQLPRSRTLLKVNQRVTLGNFDGESRLIG